MKFITKILIITFLLGVTNACDNLDLDLQTNPNAITPEKASLNDLYNNIQLELEQIFSSSERIPGRAVRMYHAAGFAYTAFTTPTSFNTLWGNAYNDLFLDVQALNDLSEAADTPFDIHDGSAKIMKAYTMMILVDLFGNVPDTEAGQGTDIIAPKSDPGQDVYAAAIALLDDAIAQLTGTNAGAPAFDNIYGGDPDKWIKAANTLKLRAALNMGDVGTFNSLVSGGNIISSASDDFQYNYGSQRSNPNSRHYRYNNHYETGDGNYLSNYFMWSLREGKVNASGVTIIDPRRRYYFYRKVSDAFGQDLTTYSCHYTDDPAASVGTNLSHWAVVDPDGRLPYCVVTDGYSGRDHLNGSGIPPDGPIRTSWGLYPFGGDFDDDTFDDTRESGTRGGLGEGIEPYMLSFYVDFMRAEAILSMGASGNARAMLEDGIRGSMDKVLSFESLVSAKMSTPVELRDGSTGTIKELFGMDDDAIDLYVSEVLALYDAAADDNARLDVVIKEFHIAAWGNGLEAYNMVRRTGFPSNLQPALEPAAGTSSDPFPRSFFYPTNHVDRNSNVEQKTLSDPVFWSPMKNLY